MFDPARLVFIDETSTNTAMVRLRGRCSRGIRLIDHVPHGHWKTITFIAGLRRRAMVAPFVLDGPMNATSFMAYLKRCLAPTLKRGDIVMMDSLPVHKVAGVREVIEAAGARLRYLPKYSPDLNPIEQAFSKLKAHLRKAAERTIPRLSRRIGALMAAFSPQECANYLRHVGYATLTHDRNPLLINNYLEKSMDRNTTGRSAWACSSKNLRDARSSITSRSRIN